MKDFVTQAEKRGVIVELSLFCPFFNEDLWNVSPWNARNNINGVGDLPRTETVTLKIVSELKKFDNLYYEICNEPYFGGVALDWQHHIAETIAKAESSFERTLNFRRQRRKIQTWPTDWSFGT